MFGSSKHAPGSRCGLIIDIGSASVAAAIVISDPDEPKPVVVWTKLEQCPIVTASDIVAQSKRITTALMQIALSVTSEGLRALTAYDEHQRISCTQVSVAAPWSYTIPKRVSVKHKNPFTITKTILDDLQRTAEQQAAETYGTEPLFEKLGLEVLHGETLHVTANGYTVTKALGQKVSEMSLVRQLTIVQKSLLAAIRDMHAQTTPRSTLYIRSFMQHMLSEVVSKTTSQLSYGLLDLSSDATEIGIVSDGQLQNVIHTRWGIYALATELALITQQPAVSAYGQLQSASTDSVSGLSSKQQTEFSAVCSEFVDKMYTLISRAAQMTELPTHYIVHCNTGTRPFVQFLVNAALAKFSGMQTSSAIIGEKLVDIVSIDETRLVLSISVFHKNQN